MRAIRADIVGLNVDAIVNAANSTLLGGGGVDGAIHRAAGPGLLTECRTLNGCRPGEAKVTGGYQLAATHVIHTVGPVWHGGDQGEADVLAACYRACMKQAASLGLNSIAFPGISTGVYGFPQMLAAPIAVRSVRLCLQSGPPLEVTFCCFSAEDLEIYETVLNQDEVK